MEFRVEKVESEYTIVRTKKGDYLRLPSILIPPSTKLGDILEIKRIASTPTRIGQRIDGMF